MRAGSVGATPQTPASPGPTRRRYSAWLGALASVALILGATGCATLPDPYLSAPAAAQLARADPCLTLLHSIDAKIDAAGVRDNQAIRVDGYPYLRADRYTVRRPVPDENWRVVAQAHVDRMAALDVEARGLEMSNLGLTPAERAEVERCQRLLTAAVSGDPAAAAAGSAKVPDDYNDNLRVLGLYPLTKIPFAGGIRSWQESVRDVFRTPFPELKVEGKRVRYVPGASPSPASLAGWLPPQKPVRPGAPVDALGTPLIDLPRAWKLLQQHAPVLVVDTLSDDDRIGSVQWSPAPSAGLLPAIDLREHVAYVRIAWTEMDGNVVLQLVYGFWFPARTRQSVVDIEAGHIDSLMWRVTLASDGRPLAYDSIHSCGCFQMFFPTEYVRERPAPIEGEGFFDESLFVPQFLRAPAPEERVAVYLAARTHTIQRVAVEAVPSPPGLVYRLVDENRLRALPLPGGSVATRSVYGPDMRVPGTERRERWVYWPAGIESPGQMRQWGHHPTAFVGRRHFDDPFLFDRYFTLAPRQASQ
ncbi:MAG: hypothetical protein ACREBN_10140 [Burkholderiaceae bacterium]